MIDLYKLMILLLNKIRRNGFGWLFKRIKYELIHPDFFIFVHIAKKRDSFRRLYECIIPVPRNEMVSGDTLIAVYDLNSSAITFDFAFFLSAAETYGKINGKLKLFVLFVEKDSTSFLDKDYLSVVSEDGQKWRFNNIVMPLAQLYPACSGYAFLPSSSRINNYINNHLVYPPGYSSVYKPRMKYAEIFSLINRNLFSGFIASREGIDYIRQWMLSNNITNKIIVITLRSSEYDKSRNSNLEEWIKFANWVKNEGYTPIFIPDTDSCWDNIQELANFIVFVEPCWNLGLRMALYEIAYLNFFYSSGTSALGVLNKNISLISMQPVLEDSFQAKADIFKSYGLVRGQRRYYFAEKNQFISWEKDTFENIRSEFLDFINETSNSTGGFKDEAQRA